jgi:hypothetical protein
MQWLNIELKDLDNEAFACADTADVGTWLRLMGYCCVQENGGRIRGAKTFDDRKLMFLFRLTKAEIARKTELWQWSGDDLRVLFFPAKTLKRVQALRAQGAKGNKVRWGNDDPSSDRISDPSSNGSSESNCDSLGESPGESGKERKGKERKEREGKRPVADGDGRKPRDLKTCVSFFLSIGSSASEAEKFFHHYRANGWRQGGRTPLESWHSQGQKWVVDSAEPQKSPTGGQPAGFDPSAPHAHTGGVEVANP